MKIHDFFEFPLWRRGSEGLRFFGDFLPRFLAISGPNKIIIISLGWGEGEGASSGGQWEMPSAAPSAR